MKKLWILGIMACLGFTVPVFAEGDEPLISGEYMYSVLEDGTIEIKQYLGQDEEVEIPTELDGYVVTSIGVDAFAAKNNIISIELPEGITSVNELAFEGCDNLERISFPESISFVGSNPMAGCGDVDLQVSFDHQYLEVIEGALYSKPDKRLIYCPTTVESYVFPEDIASIGGYAFFDCYKLKSITLSNDISAIGDNPFASCGEVEIKVAPDHPYLAMIDGVLFSKSDKRLVYCPPTKESYVVPEGIEYIGKGAFYNCEYLTDITIPDTVTSIGDSAFSNCRYLENIVLPDSVKDIGNSAFAFCESLTSIVIPEGVPCIRWATFIACSSLSSVTLPNSITSIGYNAFYGCESLTSINLPESINSIGYWAFEGCKNLTIIVSHDSYTEKYCKKEGLDYTFPDANDWLTS